MDAFQKDTPAVDTQFTVKDHYDNGNTTYSTTASNHSKNQVEMDMSTTPFHIDGSVIESTAVLSRCTSKKKRTLPKWMSGHKEKVDEVEKESLPPLKVCILVVLVHFATVCFVIRN